MVTEYLYCRILMSSEVMNMQKTRNRKLKINVTYINIAANNYQYEKNVASHMKDKKQTTAENIQPKQNKTNENSRY